MLDTELQRAYLSRHWLRLLTPKMHRDAEARLAKHHWKRISMQAARDGVMVTYEGLRDR